MIARILTWLASPQGRIVAALALFALVALLERTPWVRDQLDGRPVAKRIVAVAITIAAAAATALYAGVPLAQVGEAALVTLLGATGLNTLAAKKLP